MPKLWDETIEAHRHAVREASLDATTTLVAEHGLRLVTMSKIAEATGIGRATLYKYFPDVEAILLAWHEREIRNHLGQLETARDSARSAAERLHAAMETYAFIAHDSLGRHDTDLAAWLHRDEHVGRSERHLRDLFRALLEEAVASGDVRGDVPTDELAIYCVQAVAAARSLSSKAAVRRLVNVTLSGLRPPT